MVEQAVAKPGCLLQKVFQLRPDWVTLWMFLSLGSSRATAFYPHGELSGANIINIYGHYFIA
jgi:hypothetical protein